MVDKRCRICYLGASASKPLYHPCKCTGSIRYVHAACLSNWLRSINCLKCEVCGHQIEFASEVLVGFQRLRVLCAFASFGYIAMDYLFRRFWYVPHAFVISAFVFFAFYVVVEAIPIFRPSKRPLNYREASDPLVTGSDV